MNTEERLIRLEENLVFMERQCEGLNDALLTQQRQLDQLERLSAGQAAKILELEELMEVGSGRGTLGHEKPPHY
ncbi:MAG: SlyX family protein [Deltaproteobacteria bacterium]|jgi:uncharacterized coiled-coil protein SlyX|nr:SlyX family protein [Deltaproteobacteria bacterium]